jgi:hypothetical protein
MGSHAVDIRAYVSSTISHLVPVRSIRTAQERDICLQPEWLIYSAKPNLATCTPDS